MKDISLLPFLFFVILPDESGIGDLNFVNGFLSLVILNWIEDLNFENSVQKRDSRFRENDKVEEREKGDSRFHGNDKGGENDKMDGNDKTFFVILNWIEDLYYEDGFLSLVILPDESGIGDLNFEDSMQKRDSRFRGNDKGGENDKTLFVILNWIGDLYYANCMQKRDSRFHGNDKMGENDKMGGNDKTFFVILNLIGDLYYENGFLFLVILPDKSGIGDLYRVNTKFVETLETNV